VIVPAGNSLCVGAGKGEERSGFVPGEKKGKERAKAFTVYKKKGGTKKLRSLSTTNHPKEKKRDLSWCPGGGEKVATKKNGNFRQPKEKRPAQQKKEKKGLPQVVVTT